MEKATLRHLYADRVFWQELISSLLISVLNWIVGDIYGSWFDFRVLVFCPKQLVGFFLSKRIIFISPSIILLGSILGGEELFAAWFIRLGGTQTHTKSQMCIVSFFVIIRLLLLGNHTFHKVCIWIRMCKKHYNGLSEKTVQNKNSV